MGVPDKIDLYFTRAAALMVCRKKWERVGMNYIFITLVVIYAGLSFYVMRFWLRPTEGKALPQKAELMILAPTLLLHGFWLWAPLLSERLMVLSFGHALTLVSWLMLVMYWCGSFFYALKGLQLLLYPLTMVCLLLAFIFPGHAEGSILPNQYVLLHIVASLLSYSLFGLATLMAWLVIFLDKQLRKKNFSALVSFLPPLLSLERLMFQMIGLGFIGLTITVVGGTFFSEAIFGYAFEWTHKAVFGVMSWLAYAFLLIMRWRLNWRGKKAAIWVVLGFVFMLLAYMGSKFVSEIVLGLS